MIKNVLFIFGALVLSISATAQTPQQRPAAPEKPSPFVKTIVVKEKPALKLSATYDYSMVNPSNLNDHRSSTLWNSTTPSEGKFNALGGFTLAGAFRLSDSYLGLEYTMASQELANTLILPTSNTVRDTFEMQTLYATYDLILSESDTQSIEVGGGVGYALVYKYHNIIKSGSNEEDVYWEANPILFKVRGTYNYHFSENVRVKAGIAYEYTTPTAVSADSNHPSVTMNGSPVISGQNLKNNTGQDVKVDMSGLRLNLGLAIAF